MGEWSGKNLYFLIVVGKGEEGSKGGEKEEGKNRVFKGNNIVMGFDGSK